MIEFLRFIILIFYIILSYFNKMHYEIEILNLLLVIFFFFKKKVYLNISIFHGMVKGDQIEDCEIVIM